MMESKELNFVRVLPEDNHTMLNIGKTTFYQSFGPPLNTEENIQKYLNQHFTLPKITQEILRPESYFYFIKHQKDIVGYIKLNFGTAQTETITGNSLEIERIYLVQAHQGKGIGLNILNWIITFAEKYTVDFVWLGVWDRNIRAIKFYKRNGFIKFGEHPFLLGNDLQTDHLMKRLL
ncbi:GNAT family N-acetyltransferase [uncultured Aquimarina sp.]|uniref:GNAT family N-acetyltransferase n=1 Tax=uncultured Aquimarina sp. TaxID=575652 RepID=UPI00260D7675|nr:GNAT family N-acetyltransferase [uncultured Aquimarina sp.]